MQLKNLIILALIAVISVGLAFFVLSKGYIPLGILENETVESQTETIENKTGEVEQSEAISEEVEIGNSVVEASEKLPDMDLIALEPIIVNLRGSFGRRYLKITINLGIKKDEEGGKDGKKKKDEGLSVKETVEGKLVEIRDILISVLSAKSIDDVDGWANQDIIRDEIRDVLNRELKLDRGIRKVFFTEFVVQ